MHSRRYQPIPGSHEERMYRIFGYRESKARVCPRVTAGKRCSSRPDCVCRRYRRPLDHGRIWLDHEGKSVFTSEPYSLNGEDIAALVSEMEELGLTVTLEGRSQWNPGSTLLLRITRGSPDDGGWHAVRDATDRKAK